jgi:hypothetical protein
MKKFKLLFKVIINWSTFYVYINDLAASWHMCNICKDLPNMSDLYEKNKKNIDERIGQIDRHFLG